MLINWHKIKSTRLYNWIFRTRNRVELLEILFSKFKFNFNSMEFCFKQEIKSLKAEVWDLKQRVAKLEQNKNLHTITGDIWQVIRANQNNIEKLQKRSAKLEKNMEIALKDSQTLFKRLNYRDEQDAIKHSK